MTRIHGGPDSQGAARWDFSTNANACGPCPAAMEAVRAADATRYPDPQYHGLRDRLAQWHGVRADRIVPAASASEFIMRVTAVGARLAPGPVAVPVHAYADYGAAARAHGRSVVPGGDAVATLAWCCDPSTPWGQAAPLVPAGPAPAQAMQVLDCAYAPLRLDDEGPGPGASLDGVFQLFSPNKALGLTGVRGAYAIAPLGADEWVAALNAGAPSWPLGAHAVAMLEAWTGDDVQHWLTRSRDILRTWKREQLELFRVLGCEPVPSVANFFCTRWPSDLPLAALRLEGIALRDCASFGLPGWVRASVQAPAAQQALRLAVERGRGTCAEPARGSAHVPPGRGDHHQFDEA